mmetsp:Transcript_18842/g.45275  ORF Transcript_18842/g.45275 Transcript_18842/m.45275 type:complete len:293 (+) Transcript_18842:107-985(+)
MMHIPKGMCTSGRGINSVNATISTFPFLCYLAPSYREKTCDTGARAAAFYWFPLETHGCNLPTSFYSRPKRSPRKLSASARHNANTPDSSRSHCPPRSFGPPLEDKIWSEYGHGANTPMQQATGKFLDVVAKVKVEGFLALYHLPRLTNRVFIILHRICNGGLLPYKCPMLMPPQMLSSAGNEAPGDMRGENVQHASHMSIATADCYGGRAEDEPARGCYISSRQREKTSLSIHIARTAIFDLRLTLFDTKSRINVIKEVRAQFGSEEKHNEDAGGEPNEKLDKVGATTNIV